MTREVPLIHPDVILLEDWLKPLGLSGITADTALRLTAFFGTDAQSWLNLQGHYDTEKARHSMADVLARITRQEPAYA